ncbi:hypothetical protein Nepgr_021710 [Nepenthes gracilis]|uniref:Uncharacterized protein n=1 Tax=Nepenthes gracilis TaxID=150966 RepID=A0AAD3SZ61_NEPGR|nr:hypothetical protein Nepgr_021710 [Nepenthes gracilis]
MTLLLLPGWSWPPADFLEYCRSLQQYAGLGSWFDVGCAHRFLPSQGTSLDGVDFIRPESTRGGQLRWDSSLEWWC